MFTYVINAWEMAAKLSPFINLLFVLVVSKAAFILNVLRMHCALFNVYISLLCNK